MFTFLLVVQALIAASLVTVILMQRSEGGGLTGGGSPSGLMSARGAADFLTRATAILATMFILCCIALATIASLNQRTGKIDASAATGQAAPAPITAPTTTPNDPLAAAAGQAAGNATNGTAPATK
ncbi:preprotein translocase subunit SecG [Sphingomonas tabacisoli]|uniref:Protein-export membrane protein SecG n=1 Tax=Sphingomonas tabacisoli TaxID=2249466 RepID=A0ABW4I200_9SPHN